MIRVFQSRRILWIAAALWSASLPARAAFAVDRLALHQFEDGPILQSNYEFLPGETAYFSCRLNGYQSQLKDDDRVVRITWDVRPLDPAGVLIDKPAAGKIEDTLVTEDKNWLPKFLVSFVVPSFASSGTYKVAVHARDEVGKQDVNATLEFKVRGHDVATSDALTARNFRFLRGEEDTGALTSPIYHQGEMLWARFDIVGYKIAEAKNKFQVEYGLAVESSTGKQLFTQPVAAEDTGEPFYPKRYVPGGFELESGSHSA